MTCRAAGGSAGSARSGELIRVRRKGVVQCRLATGVAVPAQDKAEFQRLLNQALAIDPDRDPSSRLVTLITQRRARALLDQIDARFSQ